ncbi:MAG: glycosyltransferase family 9 protein [Longimicrobiales bacterium]
MQQHYSVPPFVSERLLARPLKTRTSIHRIVLVRFGPLADVVTTLPVIAGLRQRFPEARIEVVTSEPFVPLFASLPDIQRVHRLHSPQPDWRDVPDLAALALRISRADIVIDLQRSYSSRLLVALAWPRACAAVDRFGPRHVLDRYLDTCRAAGIDRIEPVYRPQVRSYLERRGRDLLGVAGIDFDHNGEPRQPLVCLVPAGEWPTNRWPTQRYVELARRLVHERGATIVLLGDTALATATREIAATLPNHTLDLVGRTTITETVAIVRLLRLVIGDDSPLLRLAWTQAVPTIGIFGASRRTWSRPHGPHSFSFGSEDLSCGACMRPTCARGDLFCLARLSVDDVFDAVTAVPAFREPRKPRPPLQAGPTRRRHSRKAQQ